MKIGEIMTPDPVAVGPETPLKDVAAILLAHRISGVPVIGERLEVLGVVSEADLIAKAAGPDTDGPRIISWLLGGRNVDTQKLTARTHRCAASLSLPRLTATPAASSRAKHCS